MRILSRRAELTRELAKLDDDLALALGDAEKPVEPDQVLTLEQAAERVREPAETVRRRPEYLKARVSRPGARRIRFSSRALDAIMADTAARWRR